MQVACLETILGGEVYGDFVRYMEACEWYSGAPGGFVTNSPKRRVTAFGDGSAIHEDGTLGEGGLDTTYWTAKMSMAHATLHTRPEAMPVELRALVPSLREEFRRCYPDAMITDHTYSIAVCNYYTDPDMYIAAHTDCNTWYPSESGVGPVFASITLYPDGEPESDRDFARFSIRPEGQAWQPVKLCHGTVLTMPSGTLHRVQPCLASRRHAFRPRINITFRSTYTPDVDPLMHRMAVSNHTRYYRVPHCITTASDVDVEMIREIIGIYSAFAVAHGYPPLDHDSLEYTRETRKLKRRLELSEYTKRGGPSYRITNNIVYETLVSL
jgi:hypothetical protein